MKHAHVVAGGGAVDMEVSRALRDHARTIPGNNGVSLWGGLGCGWGTYLTNFSIKKLVKKVRIVSKAVVVQLAGSSH
jgi:hypothetical protein